MDSSYCPLPVYTVLPVISMSA